MSKPISPFVEPTVADNRKPESLPGSQGFSLVQIYPVNIIEGMTRIEANSTSIGRDESNDIALNDTSVSRNHARIEKIEDRYRIVDLGSTNGSFVDEVLVTSQVLEGGETIRFGSHIFKFLNNGIEASYHETVYNAMTRDGLTKAYNKSFMYDALEHEMIRSRRFARPMSIMLMDIDHFKKINDTFGHLAGDQVLREFCARIQSSVDSDHLVCRYGGEEFVVILGETGLEAACQIAEKCRVAVASSDILTSVGKIPTTVSIGVAEYASVVDSVSSDQLLKLADEHLYVAKRSGRNRVCS